MIEKCPVCAHARLKEVCGKCVELQNEQPYLWARLMLESKIGEQIGLEKSRLSKITHGIVHGLTDGEIGKRVKYLRKGVIPQVREIAEGIPEIASFLYKE